MDFADIAALRLVSQQIIGTKITTVKDMLGRMGALQAQDYAMVKWAVGVRFPKTTDQAIETAINKGEILRTHVLRPTWHLVSAENIYWMLALTAPQIKSSLKYRHTELEISEAVTAQSNRLIENTLRDGAHLTRDELVAELEKAGLINDTSRAYHLLLLAELDGIICSGAIIDRKQTYALLEKRIPRLKPLSREEALARLAKLYFSSRGPASVEDFVWWSRLSVGDARRALAMVKSDLTSETVYSQAYWFSNDISFPDTSKEEVSLLPAFDEFIISYKDRTASLPLANFHRAVSSNGIFRPVIVVDGQVIGIWKRTLKKNKVIVETEFFQQPGKTTVSLVEQAAETYGCFLEKKTEVIHKV
jgi:hypothetical protein